MAATLLGNVFVYGSLLAPEVLTSLLHRVPRCALAVVDGYQRHSIKDRIYPAVTPSNGHKVFGKVLFDLTEEEIQILDEFEDIEYTKLVVSPRLLNARDLDGELVVENGSSKSPDGEAEAVIAANCLGRISNALTLTSVDTKSNENTTIHMPPDRVIDVASIETEVTAYLYVWANLKDPNLIGSWDYEVFEKTHLEEYVKMCEEFESELKRAWRLEDSHE